MARTVTIAIDGEKLRHEFTVEFTVRNVAMVDASEKCGFEKSYFSKCSRQNKITKYGITLLDRMYNIKFEDYKIDDVEEPKPEVVTNTQFTITEDVSKALHDIIYSAVYEAVKKAWSE